MRTTLTLDDDVAEMIEEEQRRSNLSFKDVVNELLRQGLRRAGQSRRSRPFETRPHSFGFRPGIDLERMNQLADELESEAFRDGHLGGK